MFSQISSRRCFTLSNIDENMYHNNHWRSYQNIPLCCHFSIHKYLIPLLWQTCILDSDQEDFDLEIPHFPNTELVCYQFLLHMCAYARHWQMSIERLDREYFERRNCWFLKVITEMWQNSKHWHFDDSLREKRNIWNNKTCVSWDFDSWKCLKDNNKKMKNLVEIAHFVAKSIAEHTMSRTNFQAYTDVNIVRGISVRTYIVSLVFLFFWYTVNRCGISFEVLLYQNLHGWIVVDKICCIKCLCIVN